jgi:superfamily I DNA/RNA helicase
MGVGGSAWHQGQRLRAAADRTSQAAGRYFAAAEGEQAVADSLAPLQQHGWVLLADRQCPDSSANIDLILVGVGGIFVIDAKNWRSVPRVVDGHLVRGGERCDAEVDNLVRVTELVEQALADLWLSPAVVHSAMVFAGWPVDARVGRVRLLGTVNAAQVITRSPGTLSGLAVRAVAAHLAGAFPAYRINHGEVEIDIPAMNAPDPLSGLLPGLHARAEYADHGPIEAWMSFLRPDQYGLVQQRWNGPARISGSAGTGKTVVALHRATRLARRDAGPVLWTTLVKNLPRVQRSLLERLEPDLDDRVDCVNLHKWARDFLRQRGRRVRVDGCENGFNLAWLRVGHRRTLADIEPRSGYWREEIDYVIKGRGVVTFEEYAAIERHGRRLRLSDEHRHEVWRLYLEYERLRIEGGRDDFADLLLAALAEVRRTPLERPYASVIVDEVQDLTLTAVRLVHALVGDAPDGLLLIGDGQQKVYPGGFKLSDAGISVRGRARVLRHNYRNGSAIFDRAQQFLAGATFEEIDDTEPDRQPVGITDRIGQVIDVLCDSQVDLDLALVDSLGQLVADATQRGASVVLCPTNTAVDRYYLLLRRAGMRVQTLDDYDGRTNDAVKVGTYLRVKGLEFKHVFMPGYDDFLRSAERGGAADPDYLHRTRSQVYVGMTRARDTLWLGSVATAAGPRH